MYLKAVLLPTSIFILFLLHLKINSVHVQRCLRAEMYKDA